MNAAGLQTTDSFVLNLHPGSGMHTAHTHTEVSLSYNGYLFIGNMYVVDSSCLVGLSQTNTVQLTRCTYHRW